MTYSLLCDMEKADSAKPKAMQEIYARFEKMGFEDISSETPFAAPMKEIALARECNSLVRGC